MTGGPTRLASAAALLMSAACERTSASSAIDHGPTPPTHDAVAMDAPGPAAPLTIVPPTPAPTATPPAVTQPPASATAAPPAVIQPPETPIGRRRTKRALMLYVQPRLGTAFRGKIPRDEVFQLLERVEGDDCGGEGWGRVDVAAYACLHHTEPIEDEPVVLPATLPDGLAPFYYARLQPKNATGTQPSAPRWRSRRAMRAEAPPEDYLEPEHDYGFVDRRRYRGGVVLTTANHRVVRERDIKRMKPSDFAGRDVLARPIPARNVMMWSIEWPYAVVRAEPDSKATEVGQLPLHAEGLAHEQPLHDVGDPSWVPVAEPVAGWVLAEQVRYWVPMGPPADVRAEEVWLDVDLRQQTLALRRGPNIELLTLISSGNWKHATPLGLFRIQSKWAYADMRSRAGDDETYFVEGVPWVQYFRGRYALHGTFWHNRFGRRTSHGCINLSVHDARWVYEHTAPIAKPGWLVINEHVEEPGTTLRIRKGTTQPPDRRGARPGV